MPRRIQRQRTKGWRLPPGAVYVGRPSKWGNPFSASKYGLNASLEYFRLFLTGDFSGFGAEVMRDARRGERAWGATDQVALEPASVVRMFLRGKDLVCWCPLSAPCHADVLLELANAT